MDRPMDEGNCITSRANAVGIEISQEVSAKQQGQP